MPPLGDHHRARARAVAWALAWVTFGVALLISAWRMDRLGDRGINPWSAPGLTPGVVGALMIVLALVLLWQALRPTVAKPMASSEGATHAATAEAATPATPTTPVGESWRSSALALLLCLCFAVGALGRGLPFWLDAALFIFVFTAAFSWPQWQAQRSRGSPLWRPLVQTAALALLSAGAISWLFETVFLVRLP